MSRSQNTPFALVKAAAVTLILAALAACAAPFNANVQRFSSQLPAPQGQTFAIVAEDQALSGGLEFSQYAGLVASKLQTLGYAPASSPATADLIVRFDYGVDKGREKVVRTGYADPFWQPWYGSSRYGYYGRPGYHRPFSPRGNWGYGFYDPWFGGGGYESYTVYISGVSMKIDSRADGKRLFEGRAEAASTSNRLQYLVPNLVEAMFTDFPGNSGETVRISVAPEKKKR